jgi:GAF domain-containing protein
MSRRSRAGGKSLKQGRKRSAPKHGNAPNVTRNRDASIAGQETVVARLTRERDEALLRETANSEVLGLTSEPPGDLELVFRTILEHATRICNAKFGVLHLVEGDCFRRTAHYNTPPAFLELYSREPLYRPGPQTAFGRAAATKQSVHIADIAAEQLYAERDPLRVVGVEVLGIQTLVIVPMLKGSELIGAIAIYRQEVRPFTNKQIELVKNFAAQAVIAIENTRLLNELRQRTADLSESLEQQTATSEILKVISSSPGELQSVFQTILTNATRICDAKFGAVYLYDGNLFHCSGEVGSPPAYAEFQRKRGAFRPQPGTHLDRIIRTKQISETADATAEAVVGPVATIGGARSVVGVPMLKDDELIGVVGV